VVLVEVKDIDLPGEKHRAIGQTGTGTRKRRAILDKRSRIDT